MPYIADQQKSGRVDWAADNMCGNSTEPVVWGQEEAAKVHNPHWSHFVQFTTNIIREYDQWLDLYTQQLEKFALQNGIPVSRISTNSWNVESL